MSASSVAIIDIGSNSIKMLVAKRGDDGGLQTLATKTLDARISAGISQLTPQLTDASTTRGIAAVRELLTAVAPYSPERLLLVATSAVRDAANGAVFRERVREATGQPIRVLTGDEEANLIGRGLTCDPALAGLRNFYVFDLGGGSLECLAFRNRKIESAASLQLGCVRLTEQFVMHADAPLTSAVRASIARQVQTTLAESAFAWSLPNPATAVGTGGTITTVRAILATRAGSALEETDAVVSIAQIQELLDELSALPLPERQRVPGLPAARADVFPVALATLIALAEAGKFQAYRHSFYNLRYGLAADALGLD